MPRLVLCCDWMVSDGQSSYEGVDKFNQFLAPGFIALSSGVLEEARDLQSLIQKRIGQRILDANGIKIELHKGMKAFNAILKRRGKAGCASELLVCGFPESRPLVIHVSAHGVSEVLDFRAIGTGYPFAESLFRWRMTTQPLNPFENLHDVVYRVYEGKRLAETADGVGKMTTLAIMSHGAEPEDLFRLRFANFAWLEFLGSAFDRYGPQYLPHQRDDLRYAPEPVSNSGSHSEGNS